MFMVETVALGDGFLIDFDTPAFQVWQNLAAEARSGSSVPPNLNTSRAPGLSYLRLPLIMVALS